MSAITRLLLNSRRRSPPSSFAGVFIATRLRPDAYLDATVSPAEAARQLGIGRFTIYRKMQRPGIGRPQ